MHSALKIGLAIAALITSTQTYAEQIITGSVYADRDVDGLWSTLTVTRGQGGNQIIAENINMKIPFTCKTILNYKDNVTVPPGYNQNEFLSRNLNSCTWTTNECGLPACTSENVTLLAGRYYMPSRSQLCAVYQTANGGTTAPRCFKYISGADKDITAQGATIKIAPAQK